MLDRRRRQTRLRRQECPEKTASAADRAAALQAIAKIFEEQYVFPQLRPQIVARLDAAKDEGRYDVDDPIVFAERITQDLREASHDGHALRSFPAGPR